MISCCGTDCTKCGYYLSVCQGCANIKGKVFWLEYTEDEICDIYHCCSHSKRYTHCGQCSELPCSYYEREDPTKSSEENLEDYKQQMEALREQKQLEDRVEGLYLEDEKKAYENLQWLYRKSQEGNKVYEFFDSFVQMLNSRNSYIRNRGILLIAANAKWDTENRITIILDDYLMRIVDEKPITSRQCIKSLPIIAKHKPELKKDIRSALSSALETAFMEKYTDSMRSLVVKDIKEAILKIKEIGE